MTQLAIVLAEAGHGELPIPALVIAGMAAAVFLVLGVVTWSYREVSNRHSQKFGAGANEHHTSGH